MGEKGILTSASVQEYFRELLTGAIENQRAPLQPMTEYYLVDLLSRFMDTARLYERRPDGTLEEEPLAFILQRALEGNREQRAQALRKLGDNALYIAGFFADSLGKRLVDVDYYIAMGGSAYGALSNLARLNAAGSFADLYAELCRKFTVIVDLFNEISERAAVTTSQGVVRLYERWIKTGSERLTRLLAEQGVIPAMAKPGIVQ